MTETSTLTLADFLLQRIAEDEAAAQAATPGPWSVDAGSLHIEVVSAEDDLIYRRVNDMQAPDDAAHIARHDPARVLAECEAKRQLIHQVEQVAEYVDATSENHRIYNEATITHRLLAPLAQPHASHPEFRAEWAL